MRKASTRQRESAKRKLDAELDEALTGTFPASDPIAVGHPTATEPPSRPPECKAPTIDREALAAARRPQRGRARG
jgi:hypothetical protein